MSNNLTIDPMMAFFGKLIADECNVKEVIFNGVTIHKEPMLADKYREKQKQFDKIYSEYTETE